MKALEAIVIFLLAEGPDSDSVEKVLKSVFGFPVACLSFAWPVLFELLGHTNLIICFYS